MKIEVFNVRTKVSTELKDLIDYEYTHRFETNTDRIVIRFKKENNNMSKVRKGTHIKIYIDNNKYVNAKIARILGYFGRYKDNEATIIADFNILEVIRK